MEDCWRCRQIDPASKILVDRVLQQIDPTSRSKLKKVPGNVMLCQELIYLCDSSLNDLSLLKMC
ncbi:hypothetical protein LINPERPRIM_LOCUS2163 [Linum perenne]